MKINERPFKKKISIVDCNLQYMNWLETKTPLEQKETNSHATWQACFVVNISVICQFRVPHDPPFTHAPTNVYSIPGIKMSDLKHNHFLS